MSIRTRTRGRPCGLTPERQTLLLSAIERGLPLREAASLAGISYDTFNRWRNQGEAVNAPPEFRHFCESLQRAQAIAVDALLTRIQSASQSGDWRAAAWILERRHAETWGRQQRLEHTGPNGTPIATVALSPEEARHWISDESLRELVRSTITGAG
jgi:hypothetical protein